MADFQTITAPVTWRGYTWAPEATVRFEDAAGQQLEVLADWALARGLLDMPSTNPERADFLRDWVRSGCVVPGSIDAVANRHRPRNLTGGVDVEERSSQRGSRGARRPN